MCDVKLYLCKEHNYNIHGVKIYRCDAAVARGISRNSGIIWVHALHLTQDDGCDGFRFPIDPEIMGTCPIWGEEDILV